MKAALIPAGALLLAGWLVLDMAHTSPPPTAPDPTRTPGASNPDVTQATIGTTICVRGWTATVRPPKSYTDALKRRQLATLGYADSNPHDWELDHLIPLELGGHPTDERNLWVEPWSGACGARAKDREEGRLRELVCSGSMTLSEAQKAIVAWPQECTP